MTNNRTDISKQTIAAAKKGKIDAFKKIYEWYSQPCIAIAFRFCNDKSIAEDILHDAFIKIINKISTYYSNGSFGGWVKK